MASYFMNVPLPLSVPIRIPTCNYCIIALLIIDGAAVRTDLLIYSVLCFSISVLYCTVKNGAVAVCTFANSLLYLVSRYPLETESRKGEQFDGGKQVCKVQFFGRFCTRQINTGTMLGTWGIKRFLYKRRLFTIKLKIILLCHYWNYIKIIHGLKEFNIYFTRWYIFRTFDLL